MVIPRKKRVGAGPKISQCSHPVSLPLTSFQNLDRTIQESEKTMTVEVGMLRRNRPDAWEFNTSRMRFDEYSSSLSLWGVLQSLAKEGWIASFQNVENGIPSYYFHRIHNNSPTGPR
jgi:phosphoketolase